MAAIASSNNNTNTSLLISDSESDFILSSCRVGCRLDGRSCTDFRPYRILVNDLHPLSHGSARLVGSVGHASHEQVHLTCSIKAELVRPSPHRPNQGLCELFLTHGGTVLPNNNHRHMKRTLEQTQGILTNLLADRIVDTYALCLVPHECVWKLSIDVLVLEAVGGALMDCAARVIVAALQATRLPHVVATPRDTTTKPLSSSSSFKSNNGHDNQNNNTIVVDGDVAKAHAIALAGSVRVVTLAILQDLDLSTQRPLYSIAADPNLAEETCALALVHVCIHSTTEKNDTNGHQPSQNSIVGLHKTQTGALPLSLLPDITNMALQVVEGADAAFVTQCDTEEGPMNSTPTVAEQQFTNASTILSGQFQWLAVDD